jgi:hypothetical protein
VCGTVQTWRNEWADRVGTANDAWFNPWFQTIRTTYGMFLYAQRAGDAQLQTQALSTLNLALEAPATRAGPFPSIFWVNLTTLDRGWVADQGWGGLCNLLPQSQVPRNCTGYYHLYASAWTGYWLLKWRAVVPPSHWSRQPGPTGDDAFLSLLRPFGEFVVSRLRRDAGVAAFFTPHLLLEAPYLEFNNSEMGAVALFLLDLANVTGNATFTQAATSILDFMSEVVVPARSWHDFETYFSCSPKELNTTDPLTSQSALAIGARARARSQNSRASSQRPRTTWR